MCTYCLFEGTASSLSQGDSSGTLACKMYNTSKMDCSRRNLVDIPVLDKNWTNTLDLSHNQLKEIHGTPFLNLSILTSLDLSRNRISILNSTTFRGLRLLLKLDLSENDVTDLSSDVFNDLHELLFLELSLFRLFEPNETFAPLQSLMYLYMPYFGRALDTAVYNLHSLTRLRALNLVVSANVTNATFEPLAGLPIQGLTCQWLHQICTDCYLDKTAFHPFTSVRTLSTDFIALPALGSFRSPLQSVGLISIKTKRSYTYVLHNTTLQVLSNVSESLTSLSLVAPLRRIENNAFLWIPNLIEVRITRGQLHTLNKHAFCGLTALQKLYLSNNQLTAIPSQVVGKFKSLQCLDVSSNRISAIADNAFSSLSSLTYLNIKNNGNQDFVIHTGWLKLLRNLRHLVFGDFEAGFSHVIEIDLPVPLHLLQIFEMRRTFLVKFMKNFCLTFPNVADVIISDTLISDFPFSLAFHECTLLKALDLSGSVKSINSLDLMDTNISIPNLEDLKLARNELTSIQQIFFIKSPNLTSLNLSKNQIKNIDSAIAHVFKRLVHLSIDDNALVSLSGLEHLNFLKHLNAARNQITEISIWLTSTTNQPVLIALDLSGNPFSCTCKIEHFRKWIVSDTNTWLHPGEYICASPESFEGVSISEVELDGRSFTAFYVGIIIPFVVLFCVLIVFLIRYRWYIKYKLFLLYRNYRPFPEINEDFEMLQLQYHAYVAYNENSEDHAWVLNDLQPNMEEDPEPVKLCIKSRDFIPGHSLIESISDNIQQSRNTILVLSPNFVESEWCYHEMEMAKMRLLDEHLDVIVLVLLKDIPNKKITLSLRQLLCKKEYLKWPKDRAGQRLFWQRLRQELKAPVQLDRRFCM